MNLLSLVIDLLNLLASPEERKNQAADAKRLRELAALEHEKRSIRDQYGEWAREKGLARVESTDHWRGLIAGREIVFDTGLEGETEQKPVIDVPLPLEVGDAVLVERDGGCSGDIEGRARALLDEVALLEKIWLSEDGIRLVFERRVHPEVFDAALDALEDTLRSGPYR